MNQEKELSQLFENKFDCYADMNDDSVELAMTKEQFVKVVRTYANELLKLRLGEVREIMPSIACRHLIDKTIKELDQ